MLIFFNRITINLHRIYFRILILRQFLQLFTPGFQPLFTFKHALCENDLRLRQISFYIKSILIQVSPILLIAAIGKFMNKSLHINFMQHSLGKRQSYLIRSSSLYSQYQIHIFGILRNHKPFSVKRQIIILQFFQLWFRQLPIT